MTLSEKNGVLLLSLENSHPMSMAVACAVEEGQTKVCGCAQLGELIRAGQIKVCSA